MLATPASILSVTQVIAKRCLPMCEVALARPTSLSFRLALTNPAGSCASSTAILRRQSRFTAKSVPAKAWPCIGARFSSPMKAAMNHPASSRRRFQLPHSRRRISEFWNPEGVSSSQTNPVGKSSGTAPFNSSATPENLCQHLRDRIVRSLTIIARACGCRLLRRLRWACLLPD